MKRLLSLLFLLAIIIIACSKRTVATKEVATESTQAVQPETSQATSEVADVNLLAAGKTVYETKCTRCHGIKPIDFYTPERWDAILKMMVPKAKLTEGETEQVTAYVKANAKK